MKLLKGSLAVDGQDGNGLQLENASPTSSSSGVVSCKNRLNLILAYSDVLGVFCV